MNTINYLFSLIREGDLAVVALLGLPGHILGHEVLEVGLSGDCVLLEQLITVVLHDEEHRLESDNNGVL